MRIIVTIRHVRRVYNNENRIFGNADIVETRERREKNKP